MNAASWIGRTVGGYRIDSLERETGDVLFFRGTQLGTAEPVAVEVHGGRAVASEAQRQALRARLEAAARAGEAARILAILEVDGALVVVRAAAAAPAKRAKGERARDGGRAGETPAGEAKEGEKAEAWQLTPRMLPEAELFDAEEVDDLVFDERAPLEQADILEALADDDAGAEPAAGGDAGGDAGSDAFARASPRPVAPVGEPLEERSRREAAPKDLARDIAKTGFAAPPAPAASTAPPPPPPPPPPVPPTRVGKQAAPPAPGAPPGPPTTLRLQAEAPGGGGAAAGAGATASGAGLSGVSAGRARSRAGPPGSAGPTTTEADAAAAPPRPTLAPAPAPPEPMRKARSVASEARAPAAPPAASAPPAMAAPATPPSIAAPQPMPMQAEQKPSKEAKLDAGPPAAAAGTLDIDFELARSRAPEPSPSASPSRAAAVSTSDAPRRPAPPAEIDAPPTPVMQAQPASMMQAKGGFLSGLASRSRAAPPAPAPKRKPPPKPKPKRDVFSLTDEQERQKTEAASTVDRRATVRHYGQMNPGKTYPLLVVISEGRIEPVRIQGVTQVESKQTFAIKKENPFVRIEPVLAGCAVSPSAIDLDVSRKVADARFLVTPIVEGEIPEARVEIRYEGRVVDKVPIPSKIAKQTIAKVSAALSFLSPVVTKLVPLLTGGRSAEELAKTGALGAYGRVVAWAGGTTNLGLAFTGVLALVALAFYIRNRAKEAEPVERFFDYATAGREPEDLEVTRRKQRLVVLAQGERREHRLDVREATVGGDPGATIFLRDPSVRFQHAVFGFDGSAFRVHALGGAPLEVEGRAVDEALLPDKEATVRVGGATLWLYRATEDEELDEPTLRERILQQLGRLLPQSVEAIAAAAAAPGLALREVVAALLVSGAIDLATWRDAVALARGAKGPA